MIEAPSMAQHKSVEPHSPTVIMQNVLVGLELESARISTTKVEEETIAETADDVQQD